MKEIPDLIKSIHHICIETDRYSDSINFYCSLLEFSIIEETKNFHGRDFNTWIKKENIIIELQTPKSGAADSFGPGINTGIVHVCFIVESLSGTIDMLTEKGFDLFRKKGNDIIYNVKGGLLAKITAPEGTVIELREEEVSFL
jgi:glyoxylase I family protein